MKAIHVDGYDDKWLIEMVPTHPWNPCGPVVYRLGGIAQTYNTEAEANAVIATLKPRDQQGEPAPAEPIDPNPVPRRVKRGG